MPRYAVSMNGHEFSVIVDDSGRISVEDVAEHIDVMRVSANKYSVFLGARSHTLVAVRNGESYSVLADGHELAVAVETERARLLRAYARTLDSGPHRMEIHAPMPALVVKVEVQVGDSVKPGQGLIVLEAMKMENELKSHVEGIVKEVRVTQGKPVDKGELLLILE
jgi:biotin carboxyl carrier protein